MDTIVALCTPPAAAAVGVIRISGPNAVPLVSRYFIPEGRQWRTFAQVPSHRLVYGALWDGDAVLDRCLAVFMQAPRSYTGEDVVELSLHGSPVLLGRVIRLLCRSQKARAAEPGEFTRRAFLNGKLSLQQAEAVADLISAQTEEAAQNAAGQLGGDGAFPGVSEIFDHITHILAHFQAEVDYPEEDILPFDRDAALRTLSTAAQRLAALYENYDPRLREGVTCALVGKPNVGKSSLFNALLGHDRAIVTDIPGTTRDTLEETVTLGGVYLRLIDTAGVHDRSEDTVEQLGIERARETASRAELLLIVLDGSQPLTEQDRAILDFYAGSLSVVVVNKSDLPPAFPLEPLWAAFERVCRVSALNREGLVHLGELLGPMFPVGLQPCGGVITNARQAAALRRAELSLRFCVEGLRSGLTADAALSELEHALNALGEITGRRISEEMLEDIFSRFCVGK